MNDERRLSKTKDESDVNESENHRISDFQKL